MKNKKSLYGISTIEELEKCLDIPYDWIKKAINIGYTTYPRKQKQKVRMIDEPNQELKIIQRNLLSLLKEIKLPEYVFALTKGHIENCKYHTGSLEVITMDIANFYQNTDKKYIKKYFKNKMSIKNEALELIIELTCLNGHLPTGAPTSPILSYLAHEEIFNYICNKMRLQGIKMSLYLDDITLSSKSHISNGVIKFIKKEIKKHKLWFKTPKTKHFGYKYAHITGGIRGQNNKLLIPFRLEHEIVKILKEKKIQEMNMKEIEKLLGKIANIQQMAPLKFYVSKTKARKRLKELNRLKIYYSEMIYLLKKYIEKQQGEPHE